MYRFGALKTSLSLILILVANSFNVAFADAAFAQRHDVQDFIQHMVKKHNLNKDQLVALFSEVKIRPQVIRHINKPLEKEPWKLYQLLFVNEWRITHGVAFWNKYAASLAQAEKIYGVPASIIVATIGIETRYGQRTGDYRVIDSLSSLAFGGSPRKRFFSKELEEFIMLTHEQNLDPLKIMGSYAGAIGQPQFMPSSYRYYAVNFSGSGKTDLMHNEIDVIGSIANYYRKHGWTPNEPIAVQANMSGSHPNYLLNNVNFNRVFTLAQLSRYGITPRYKHTSTDNKVKLIELASRDNKEYWLGYRNFDVIKRYNASDLYAMAVYQLSYYIATAKHKLG